MQKSHFIKCNQNQTGIECNKNQESKIKFTFNFITFNPDYVKDMEYQKQYIYPFYF